MDKNNALNNSVFRKHFEHYDERIEEWFKDQSSGVYIDLAMNPSLNCNLNSHRGCNSLNNTLLFRDELLDMNEILIVLE